MVTVILLECLSLSEVFDNNMTSLGQNLVDENPKLSKTRPPGCILLRLGSHQTSVVEVFSKVYDFVEDLLQRQASK